MDTRIIQRITWLGFAIIIITLMRYQIIEGEFFLNRAQANYIRLVPKIPVRGSVYDRGGVRVAYDKPVFNLAVIPYQVRGEDGLFLSIAKVLGRKADELKENYKKNIRNLFAPVCIVKGISKEEALRAKEIFKDNIIIDVTPLRVYPFSYSLSHILGYVKKAEAFYGELKSYGYVPSERAGFLGIEQYYDGYLKGKGGGQLIEVDSTGKVVGFLGEEIPQRGKDIRLTIDVRMQKAAYRALKGYRGTIILMDSRNGELFVLCSSPSYNLNDFVSGRDLSRIFNNPQRVLINRGIQASYPPGSVFKSIVAVAGLEERKITPYTTFDCSGKFSLGNHIFSCWMPHGPQNLYEAIVHSCNIYFYNLGLRVGVNEISRWAKKFGFSELTGIDLPYEKRGTIPSPRWKRRVLHQNWFKGDTVNMAIGQGYVSVTPLQALVAINAFANGGYLVRPHLLKEVDGVETSLGGSRYVGCSRKTIEYVRKCLRGVVSRSDGTAYALEDLGLAIAGKTGTAQNNKGAPHGWFVGFFPYNHPVYSICVFLENAGSSHEAVGVAHTFLKDLLDKKLITIKNHKS